MAFIRVGRKRAEQAYLGDRLYTEVRGQGDPMVFLAGLPATTHFWQDLYPAAGAGTFSLGGEGEKKTGGDPILSALAN